MLAYIKALSTIPEFTLQVFFVKDQFQLKKWQQSILHSPTQRVIIMQLLPSRVTSQLAAESFHLPSRDNDTSVEGNADMVPLP